jgi:hypothetical protein
VRRTPRNAIAALAVMRTDLRLTIKVFVLLAGQKFTSWPVPLTLCEEPWSTPHKNDANANERKQVMVLLAMAGRNNTNDQQRRWDF